ncbi:Type 1 glutamine amidotransferase-like domain-containing protein [Actinokineospora sp. G85]|uniref:Type 1 glutamine amidotransferase-like domain-containing protein n=1 Tax=Actinokineospora sp. G85 TaxID=3406626 RepID=UPI003C73061D
MRLYLSSFRIGNEPDALVGLLRPGQGRRTALILNADDYKSAEDRAVSGKREVDELSALGLEPFEVDLREHFGDPDGVRAALSGADVVYVRGGSGFVLRRAYAHSGADDVLRDLIARDEVVYAGYSAGPCMLGPTLRGIDGAIDLPDLIPDGYPEGPTPWDCLGVLPYCIAPHYRSDHPESAEIERTVQYYIDNQMLFVALRDGQALVVDGDKTRVVG